MPGAVTVGGLVINLSANTGQLTTDMAQGARTVDASARTMSTSLAGVTDSSGRVTEAGARLVRQLREEIAALGMTGQGVQQYRGSLNGLGGDLRSQEAAIRATTDARQAERTATSMLTDAVKALAAGYAALKVGEYVKDATLLAARYETLGVVMNNVGKNAGYTKEAMAGFEKGLQSTGISMVQSRESLTAMAQAHIDLSQSMKLARVAQDAAVIGAISSSEAFQRMTVGIQQGDVEILRNLGLNVNFQAAYALTAATLHKHVDLLTSTEKMQAGVNAVMAVGSDIAGTYEQAMSTAGKQLSSMSRYVEDLKVKVGSVFLDAFTKQVEAQTLAFKTLGLVMDDSLKGGALTTFAAATGEAAGSVVSGIVLATTTLSTHKEAVQDVIAIYAIYKAALLAVPLVEAAAAAAPLISALIMQGTVTWGATGAALAQAEANAAETSTALARALSSNAVAVANVEQATTTLAATTSIQGQFIATEALTAAQAALATTTQAVAITQGEAAVAAGALTVASRAAAAGTWLMTAAVGALEAAMAVLLSPITLVVAGLGLAAVAYNHFRSEASKKVDNNLPSFDATREQLEKLNAEQKYGTGLLGDNAKQIEAVTAKIKELKLAKEAKVASMGSSESQYTLRLKSEVAGITDQVKKYGAQLDQLQQIRLKLGGADKRADLGSYEPLQALTAKYALPPARRADVLASLQPAIDAAKKLAENKTYGGDEAAQAQARAAELAGIEQQAANARLGINYAFSSEINTANKASEVAAQNAATRLAAVNAKAFADAKATYDMRLTSQAEYIDKENALNEKEAAAALRVANAKVAAARATVGGDPVANAQTISTAVAERDALAQKNALQAAEGRRKAAEAAIEDYTKEFGSIANIIGAQEDLVRVSRQSYQQAGMTAEQQQIWTAKHLQASADQLAQDVKEKQARGEASQEFIQNAQAMKSALAQMSEAQMKAVAPAVSAQFINDAKAMRDETTILYGEMKETFVGTDEERVRSAAATAVRLAAIRLADAEDAIKDSNDSDADKQAKRAKLLGDYRKYVDAVNANADVRVLEASNGFRVLADTLSAALDPTKVEQFGSAMQSAFGGAGGAIGGLVDAMNNYGLQQAAMEEARVAAAQRYAGDQKKLGTATTAINEQQTRSTLAYYTNVAGAAKGFFNENSKGYKAMAVVQQAFHAVELALAIESALTKTGLIAGVTAAETTNTAARVTTQATATATSTSLAATEASAWGVTAVVKAIASLPFPFNLAAGAATLAAVVGIGAKMSGSLGGGSVSLSAQRQKEQGTGSVLGDKDAKSESISKALELIEKNTYQDLAINTSMLASLRNIESSVANFANQLVRSTDITSPDVNLKSGYGATTLAKADMVATGAEIGMLFGAPFVGALVGGIASKVPVVQKLMTSVFGGKQSVEDSGFGMDAASLASILSTGAKAYQYADIKTSGGWFRRDKSSVQANPLDEAANRQFTGVITSLADSITAAGSVLGLSGDAFTSKLNSFVVDIGKISLKDLKGDELQKAIESVFSKLGDDMAQFAVGGLAQYQDVGEGYLETLARIATEYQAVDVVLQSFGKTFSMVGMESIAARDRLVDLAGGLEKFTSQGEYFLTNFFSDQEQAAALKKRIDPTLAQYGLSTEGEDASKMFRDLVLGLDETTAGGAQAYSALMAIAPAFKQIVDAQKDVLDARKDLQDKLDELTMSAVQLLEKQRTALDESNRALFDQVHVLGQQKDLQDQLDNLLLTSEEFRERERAAIDASNLALFDRITALNAEKESMTYVLGYVENAFTVLKDVTKRTTDELTKRIEKEKALAEAVRSTLDSIDPPGQEEIDRKSAQAQIQTALAIAKAGGPLPVADDLKKALSTLGKDASGQFSSYTDYLRDLYTTKSTLAELGGLADDSLSVDQKQLDSLNSMLEAQQRQIDILKGIDSTGLSIAQALEAFKLAAGEAKGNPGVAANVAIADAYKSSLGRAPDGAGLEYWSKAVSAGASLADVTSSIANSREAQVQAAYKELLGGRTADAAGLSYWLQSGLSIDGIKAEIKKSGEYKALHPFAVGTNFIPQDMPAMVHKGERIIPAADNRLLMDRLSRPEQGGVTQLFDAMLQENRALREEMKGLRAEVRAVAGHTEKTSRLTRALEGDQLKFTTEAA